VLKESYIQIAKQGTTKKNSKQNMPKFNDHPKLRNEMFFFAKNEANWPTTINKYCATHLDTIHVLKFIRPRHERFTSQKNGLNSS
jgi:hypothetical protein